MNAHNELIVQSVHLTLRKWNQIWASASTKSVWILCLFLVFQTLLPCMCAVFEACWHPLSSWSWHPRSISGCPTWKHLKGKPQGRRYGWLSRLLDFGWPSIVSSQQSSFILYLFSKNHGYLLISCVLIRFSSSYHNINIIIKNIIS